MVVCEGDTAPAPCVPPERAGAAGTKGHSGRYGEPPQT